ncbi:MAG: hypothetical protein MK108_10710 [Mariniblastus sp.]|nr:hypothetical protein [Mariniblastus sp.]
MTLPTGCTANDYPVIASFGFSSGDPLQCFLRAGYPVDRNARYRAAIFPVPFRGPHVVDRFGGSVEI